MDESFFKKDQAKRGVSMGHSFGKPKHIARHANAENCARDPTGEPKLQWRKIHLDGPMRKLVETACKPALEELWGTPPHRIFPDRQAVRLSGPWFDSAHTRQINITH